MAHIAAAIGFQAACEQIAVVDRKNTPVATVRPAIVLGFPGMIYHGTSLTGKVGSGIAGPAGPEDIVGIDPIFPAC